MDLFSSDYLHLSLTIFNLYLLGVSIAEGLK